MGSATIRVTTIWWGSCFVLKFASIGQWSFLEQTKKITCSRDDDLSSQQAKACPWQTERFFTDSKLQAVENLYQPLVDIMAWTLILWSPHRMQSGLHSRWVETTQRKNMDRRRYSWTLSEDWGLEEASVVKTWGFEEATMPVSAQDHVRCCERYFIRICCLPMAFMFLSRRIRN